eukprot:766248-Hanusia_phi.AAC.2
MDKQTLTCIVTHPFPHSNEIVEVVILMYTYIAISAPATQVLLHDQAFVIASTTGALLRLGALRLGARAFVAIETGVSREVMLPALRTVRRAQIAQASPESLTLGAVVVAGAVVLAHVLSAHVRQIPLVVAAFLAAHQPSSFTSHVVVTSAVRLVQQRAEFRLDFGLAHHALSRPGDRVEFGVEVDLQQESGPSTSKPLHLQVSSRHPGHGAQRRAVRLFVSPRFDEILHALQRLRDRGVCLGLLGGLGPVRGPCPLLLDS